MKIYQMFLTGAMFTITGCGGSSGSNSFLPGIYVSQVENEFCRITDTLVIRKKWLTDAEYEVTRKCSFQRIKGGKELSPEYQEAQWQMGYDASNCVLVSPGKTVELKYDAAINKIYKAGWRYEKVE